MLMVVFLKSKSGGAFYLMFFKHVLKIVFLAHNHTLPCIFSLTLKGVKLLNRLVFNNHTKRHDYQSAKQT